MRPSVPSAPRNWPLRRLAGKAPSCRPTGSIGCQFKGSRLCAGSRRRRPCPRGESGPEAGDGSAAQTCSSVHPAGANIGFGGVCVFQNRILGSASELVLGVKTRRRHGALFAPGLPYGFSRGIPCSAYTGKYPIPASELVPIWPHMPSGRNPKNARENIVRMGPGKITTHYTIGFRDSVSFLLTIQATGFLTVALVGLPPTEYASLCWTHLHAGLSRRYPGLLTVVISPRLTKSDENQREGRLNPSRI